MAAPTSIRLLVDWYADGGAGSSGLEDSRELARPRDIPDLLAGLFPSKLH